MISERSYAPFTVDLLERLADISEQSTNEFFAHNPRWLPYKNCLLCVVLAQGGALHYVTDSTGVKDLDVWTFYEFQSGLGHFPYRLKHQRDFGRSVFGRHTADLGYIGRRVDLFGRSIRRPPGFNAIQTVQHYLTERKTETSRFLALKPVVLIEPANRRGEVIHRPKP